MNFPLFLNSKRSPKRASSAKNFSIMNYLAFFFKDGKKSYLFAFFEGCGIKRRFVTRR